MGYDDASSIVGVAVAILTVIFLFRRQIKRAVGAWAEQVDDPSQELKDIIAREKQRMARGETDEE